MSHDITVDDREVEFYSQIAETWWDQKGPFWPLHKLNELRRSYMQDCSRLTDDDGVMFVATINRSAKAWLFAIVGAEYILRWLPKGTHRWRLFQKPSEIVAHLERGGLSLVDAVGVAANPFSRSLRITRSLAVNYMLFSARHAD